MKRLGTIAVIAGLLLVTALFYRLKPDETANDTDKVVQPKPAPTPTTPTPTTRAHADGVLTLAAATSHGYLAGNTTSDVYAAIDVSAQSDHAATRPPLNVAVVMDRSGSMRGQKLSYAKRAARRLVDQLQPKDRFTLVSYAYQARVEFASRKATGAAKASMRAAIDRVHATGETNLEQGYRTGLDEVRKNKSADTINRVVLMSDGKPTRGSKNKVYLQQVARHGLSQGVSLTTMGVGYDYNEDLMAAMADEAAGNYYYIDTPSKVVSALGAELDGLAATVARNTALVIDLADGVRLRDLYGFSHKNKDGKVMVPLAEFRADETKNILLKLAVDTDQPARTPLMDIDLSYTSIADGLQADAVATNQSVSLASVTTDDAKQIETGVDVDVISRVQQIEVAESLKDAMAKYADGQTRQAQHVLRRRRRRVREVRNKYELPGKSFDRVDRELKKTVTDMENKSVSSGAGKQMVKSKKARGRLIMQEAASF